MLGINGKARLIVIASGVVLLLALALTVWIIKGDKTPIDPCKDYRYGNCPAGCIQSCESSVCGGDYCTDDCNGPGSCRSAQTF